MHPALNAWARLTGEPVSAASDATVEVLKASPKSCVYRLRGLPSSPAGIVAKRCRIRAARIERMVHERVLPELPVPALRWHGLVEDAEFGWCFLEDVGDARADPDQGTLFARWLGSVHGAGAELARAVLPPRGGAEYLEQLRAGRARVVRYLAAGHLSAEWRAVLRRVVTHCDALEAGWPRVEAACGPAPVVLVHGDLAPKHLRTRRRGGRVELLVLDWEMAGWGPAAPDLEKLGGPEDRGRDARIRAYLERLGRPDLGLRDVERLSRIGALLRAVAGIDWASQELGKTGNNKPLWKMRDYEARLAVLAPWVLGGDVA